MPPLNQTYTYDAMGNRKAYADQALSASYATNNVNQYTAIGSAWSATYDHNGNILTDGLKTYVWDAENQLILPLRWRIPHSDPCAPITLMTGVGAERREDELWAYFWGMVRPIDYGL